MAQTKRFKVKKSVLLLDKLMDKLITVGGISVIVAVVGIMVFISAQVIPLFGKAKIQEKTAVPLVKAEETLLIGADENNELPFSLTKKGEVYFYDLKHGQEVIKKDLALNENIIEARYLADKQSLLLLLESGQFKRVMLNYAATFPGGTFSVQERKMIVSLETLNVPGLKLRSNLLALYYTQQGDMPYIYLLEGADKASVKRAVKFKLSTSEQVDLGSAFEKPYNIFTPSSDGEQFIVVRDKHEVNFYRSGSEAIKLVQSFNLESPSTVISAEYLFGDVSLVFLDEQGTQTVYSLYTPEGERRRLYGKTKAFPPFSVDETVAYEKSLRNKAYAYVSGSDFSLRYATTENIRVEKEMPFEVKSFFMAHKYNGLYFRDTSGILHFYTLKDPHPEISFRSLFGKIHYEGSAEPAYTWQSTGGSSEFEPKLNMVPLIIGSLKGTFYALLFSIPIGLMAAIFTANFVSAGFKATVKPVMEIMASLPSVVLGFMGALVIAPVVEDKVPSILLGVLFLPLFAFLASYAIQHLPQRWENRFSGERQLFVLIPVSLLAIGLAIYLGPVVEKMFFVVIDPSTGHKIADFRRWWPQVTGTSFEQRNSLVVGFMMGFATLPIIYTIAEDAISAVPRSLSSAALALGASPWMAVYKVTLPSSIAGILSAIMVGFGRAVGETMVVVMATGNTPIMEWNIFNGMRTLSANIAVELPEAPLGGTLYRSLFLGAVILFIITFFINTIAEIIRQRIREKYKIIEG